MRRIGADIALDVGVDLLGAGKNGFQPGDPQIGRQPTQVPADWLNTVQEELMAIPESAGIAQSTTDKTQVVQALKKIMQTQAYTAITTSGTAPTYTASITPTPTLVADLRLRAKFHAPTSVASTLNINGLGAKSIKQYDNVGAKIPAVIAANMLTDVEYDGTDWVILDPVPYSSGGAGEVCYFARQTAPTGFLKANGACVLVSSYAALVSAIYCGDTFNPTAEFGYRCTDSAGLTRSITGTYIKLPDLRGMFPRGWDDGRGVDDGRVFGSIQESANKYHNHGGISQPAGAHGHTAWTDSQGNHRHTTNAGADIGQGMATSANNGHPPWYTPATPTDYSGSHGHNVGIGTVGNHEHYINNDGEIESRPINMALLACIKY